MMRPAVRDFRLMATFVAAMPLALLVFMRTHLADADRVRLLEEAEQSVANLRRLQTQIVQSEKLASLGQLAAGAAHEINNPLTAILGFFRFAGGRSQPFRKSAYHRGKDSGSGAAHKNIGREIC